ncbi:hypothetical protein LU290_08320 [Moraxella nasibovis]|uniref:hypothetical protein n=1 Tax=Moraxella nasibovis TaxID=2904120 RepID=UPI0024100B1B|nr:hypothetical protein [Moraxella nasibovis]WFF38254.1 hypothetical protein LU290_08320 [Moraxella nasibovis]
MAGFLVDVNENGCKYRLIILTDRHISIHNIIKFGVNCKYYSQNFINILKFMIYKETSTVFANILTLYMPNYVFKSHLMAPNSHKKSLAMSKAFWGIIIGNWL